MQEAILPPHRSTLPRLWISDLERTLMVSHIALSTMTLTVHALLYR